MDIKQALQAADIIAEAIDTDKMTRTQEALCFFAAHYRNHLDSFKPNIGLSDKQYAKLTELASKTPQELRDIVYSCGRPENMTQLRRWNRGDLIAIAFESWLKK